MDWLAALAAGFGAALVASTAWTDWRRRRIPLGVVVVLLAVWVLAALFAPQALGGDPRAGLLCGAGSLLVGYLLYRFGWLGGGDGKLLGVVALWLGPYDLGFGLLAAAALLLLLWVWARADRGAAFRERGIPVACALAPPTVVLLVSRCIELLG